MQMIHAHGDFETRSAGNLKALGARAYAKHPTTRPWCFAWAIGDDYPEVWTPEEPGAIARLFDFIADGGTFVAHNAPFELAIWNETMRRDFGWPVLPLCQTRCTMAMAYAMALPASLDGAASAVGMPLRKDKEGYTLMMKMAKPRKMHPDGSTTWWDAPELRSRLEAYCIQDVRVERDLEKRLLPLSPQEQEIWILDQEINDRGVPLDLPAITGAMGAVSEHLAHLDAKMRAASGGWVKGCTDVIGMKDWIDLRGVAVGGLAKADVIDMLAAEDMPPDIAACLRIRQEAAKSSTAKLKAMLGAACPDGRVRGLHQYHGAATGRWAGRRVQTQNFPRPGIEQRDIEEILDLCAGGEAA